ncbi:DUF1415 domain-containing protein [Noviherbaspirillum agri]
MIVTQDMSPEAHQAVEATRHWLEKAVVGLNLCPFAKSVYIKNQVRFAISDGRTADALLADLVSELQLLQQAAPETLDTTLLIHPWVLADFLDYNDFLGIAEAALTTLGLEGVIQIASFHPQYQFADTSADDISNYTNRSPYPVLHLLRESSIDRAVAAFPDAHEIFDRNIEVMRRLGPDGWAQLGIAQKVKSSRNNEKQ